MSQHSFSRNVILLSFFCIVSGSLLNPWFLGSLLYLENGQRSLLRIILVCLFDIFAVINGIVLLVRRRQSDISIKQIIFSILTCCLALLITEGLLQVLVRISPRFDSLVSEKTAPRSIPDERFRVIPNPRFPEHDSNGYRNPQSLTKAEVVAVGDSFTYGTGVRSCQAWPHQLSQLSHRTVYNMSFGGYGAVEGLMLVEKAIEMNPSVVVFAAYNGNDLLEAYNAVYTRNIYTEFKTQDPMRQDAIVLREQNDPLNPKIGAVMKLMWSEPGNQTSSEDASSRQKSLWRSFKQLKLLKLFFAVENSVQKAFVDTPFRRFTEQKNKKNDTLYEIFETPDFKTLFTLAYRSFAMNLDDVRIEEGLNISFQAIKRMNEVSQSHSIHYVVLLIPTKERVFYELYPEYNMKPSEPMSRLIKEEEQIRSRTMSFLEENHISYIDLLPILRSCFKLGRQPYFMDNDGHFNAAGQAAVAEAVCQYINRLSPQGKE